MFELVSDDCRMVAESAAGLFADLRAADLDLRRGSGERIDKAKVRSSLADLGLFEAGEDGAFAASAQVQAIVAREAGAACLPFPVLETLATSVLTNRAGAPLSGMIVLPGGETATPTLSGSVLNGIASLTAFSADADRIVVTAALADGARVIAFAGRASKGVSLIQRSSIEPEYPTHDVKFDGVRVDHLVDGDEGEACADFLVRRASLLAAAEIAGASRQLVSMTKELLLTRSQFGQVLGANQALKHALADCHVKAEATAAAVTYAAASADAGGEDAETATFAAKHFANHSGKSIADAAQQMHGAIGYTVEFPLHLVIRRILRLTAVHGANAQLGQILFDRFKAGFSSGSFAE